MLLHIALPNGARIEVIDQLDRVVAILFDSAGQELRRAEAANDPREAARDLFESLMDAPLAPAPAALAP